MTGWTRGVAGLGSLMLAVACGEPSATDAGAVVVDAGSSDAGPPDAGAGAGTFRILAINDFHGAIAPDETRSGAGALAATVTMLRAGAGESIVVSAGDLIGASPLESGYWHDEPTIEAMNALGLSLNAIGNHELDDGPDELLRLIEGGRCHADGCGPSGEPHMGASFESLAANTFTADIGGETLLAPYVVRELAGARVAFVGLTLERTGTIAPGAAALAFGDEADSVNALIPELTAMGIEAIVVLLHEGGAQLGGPSDCIAMSGAVVDIVARMDPAIDLVLSGHTHESYVCELGGRLVTSSGANGNLVTSIDVTLGPSGDVEDAIATNVEVPSDIAPEPIVGAIVDEWVEATRSVRERVVGMLTAPLPSASGEVCRFVTDAMFEAGRVVDPGVDAAFMNRSGIRDGIDVAGDVEFGQLYGVHPFGNHLVILTLTGADLIAALDEGGSGGPLCPSASVRFTWNDTTGRTAPGTVTIDGVVVDPTASYRIVINDFNYAGGGGYTVFGDRSTGVTPAILLVEAMERYLAAQSPYTPDPVARIVNTL